MQANVRVEDADRARWITIARGNKANALMPDDCRAIQELVESVPRDVEAVVFRGEGDRSFCAGMDVVAFLDLDAGTARGYIEPLKDMLNAVRTLPLPTVSVINGACIGAGIELAAACDLRIAASHARFGLPEIKVGIPTALDAALLQQYIGLGRTKQMILTGEFHTAEEMQRWGLLTDVVPGAELDAAARKLVAKLVGNTRAVVAAQKRMFEVWQNYGIKTANDVSVDVWAAVFTDPETLASIARYKASHLSKKKTTTV
ncbi:MAG TPA: enoyl-CoA hydratase-related protein [Usitatibacter sp.]|nr:enoyl-CoA hydratase-related protein [Usitatibacter sp.]